MTADPASVYIGVDGGGSRTRVRILSHDGRRLGMAEGGSANVYLNRAAALTMIDTTIGQAALQAGLTVEDCTRAALGLGLAGISSMRIADEMAAHFAGRFARVTVRNDAVIACLGAHQGRDGGLVIAGTGSAAVLRLDGTDINLGGRGFLLGDDGSGAVMGRQAWRAALRAHDGLEETTPFLTALIAEFDYDPVAVITWGRHATSGQFGAYAPRIFAAADDGDAAAGAILAEASRAIAELVEAVVRRGAPRVSLVGGLASPLLRFLPEGTRSRLEPPMRDALDGALFLAGAPVTQVVEG